MVQRMGRIRQTFIKRTGDKLVRKYPNKFKQDFQANKKALQELIDSGELECPSKSVRNKLAGYLIRVMAPKSGRSYTSVTEQKRSTKIRTFRKGTKRKT